MKTVHTIADVRRLLEPAHQRSSLALVPTMGAFHDGHVALFEAARRECTRVVVSLFVNPTQFGDAADLANYPRDETRDERLAAAAGVDVLFVPRADEIYSPGYATWVDLEGPARGLESDFRPGHFRGVATICLKLFNIVQPDVAFFGQKDAQQVAVIKQMVKDLNVPLEIRVVATVRDTDGLALSSRNGRLSSDERRAASAVPRAIAAGVNAYAGGRDPVAAARAVLDGVAVDYVSVAEFDGRPTLAIAARFGTTRLIDNAPLEPKASAGTSRLDRAHGALSDKDIRP